MFKLIQSIFIKIFSHVETLPARRKIDRNFIQRLYPFWAIFGNEDDGYYGDDNWRKGRDKTLKLAILWWLRNPAHNLCFYTIGIADHPRTIYSTAEWGTPNKWTFHITPTPTIKFPLPLISYKGKYSFYAGWRPYGSFGLKLNKS